MEYNMPFDTQIAQFAIDSIARVNEARKLMSYELFSQVIDRTPIYFSYEPTSGNTKYNWQCTINAPSTRVLTGTDKTGTSTKKRMLKALAKVSGDDSIYFANSHPSIFLLEDGGYPKDVMYGSYNKKTGQYEIRSEDGYSKGGDKGAESGRGMVKVTLADYPYIMSRAVSIAKGL